MMQRKPTEYEGVEEKQENVYPLLHLTRIFCIRIFILLLQIYAAVMLNFLSEIMVVCFP